MIDTPGKGFGLVAKQDLVPGQFVIEYVGEVLNHNAFVKRSLKYSEEGASHFYFMTLTTDEVICLKSFLSSFGCFDVFFSHSPSCLLSLSSHARSSTLRKKETFLGL